jgi:hypothetical protein
MMAVTAPTYVLEESLSSQRLWKDTAGNRPPQPVEERAFYEHMWAHNFARSSVNYAVPVEVLTATTTGEEDDPMTTSNTTAAADMFLYVDMVETTGAEAALVSHMMNHSSTSEDEAPCLPVSFLPIATFQQQHQKQHKTNHMAVLLRGDNVFGTTVSKTFLCAPANNNQNDGRSLYQQPETIQISIASYRVVCFNNNNNNKHTFAQYLVIYRHGAIRDTIGVWKRYSDFAALAQAVLRTHHDGCFAPRDASREHLPNAVTSWKLLKKRQRWYRCLDAAYLSLKVFLLERFLHDILFESSSPKLLEEFMGSGLEDE